LWGHFKVENGSLLSEAATLEELEWVIDRQMLYYNQERRHSGLGYRAPMAYLEDEGIHPKVLVEIGPRSGSVLGAQVRGRLLPSRAQQRRGETWRWRMRWQG